MWFLVVKCSSERDAVKIKTLLRYYCEMYVNLNGSRTTTRIDIIRCSPRVFKISCDVFFRQISKVLNILSSEFKISFDYISERREPWRP